MTSIPSFHPAVSAWFERSFAAPTAAQAQAWPAIQSGRNVLIAAPTGSGKTLAAFLAAIDSLVRQGLKGELKDETQVVYVSPLKALSNDIQRNLQVPLAGISEVLREQGLPEVEIRTWVRTGDTPAGERTRMRRRPPHIVVTTPESLYILLGSESGRAMLSTTRTVIVDEIHALAPNKRGTHLAVSLERLSALCDHRLLRIGLSATQKPIEDVAHFLTGAGESRTECKIVDTGHRRARDLALALPPAPLEAVMSNDVWEQIYDQIAQLIEAHRTTLIFVNTRRLVERVTSHLAERIGEEQIAAHHGSLAKELRLDAEQRLKRGALKALVATASLELGIDIGDVDLVCQIGSPRSIANFLQRVGRSGHAVAGTPKGRLFPLSRDELVECTALIDSVNRGELDRLAIPQNALDVLSQQIVAETAAREWSEDGLFEMIRRAWPYRALPREDFTQVVNMLGDGFSTRLGRRGALIHHDGVNHRLRGRRGARLTALTSGGAIPDNADYKVLLEPENIFVGSVHEDFAVESLAGDVFQLGNHSYRILRVERGTVRVEDAHGMAPTIPFWLGEAPGRSDELSASVSRLRTKIAELLERDPTGEQARNWLLKDVGLSETASRELIEYLMSSHAALGTLPTQETIVFERFFDEAGGMQLVMHSPFGSRINRAWGLALRKRFCRKFNFELQAAATEDNIVLSLTTAHSFELVDVARYLNSNTVKPLLIQALLDAPMFTTRWRWVTGISLALPRFRGGKKVAPQLARMAAEDLLASVFPDQVACGENLVGEREIPDHPLVRQTIEDCLTEAMDLAGLERLLTRIERGEIRIVACDLTEPSPLALEVLSARPYAYLDDAPLEERRTQAVMSRRWLAPEVAADLGRLDTEAIARVRAEAWPEPANADELHDALVWLGHLTAEEVSAAPDWGDWLRELARQKRAAQLLTATGTLWITAERLPEFRALWPTAKLVPEIAAPLPFGARNWSPEEALVEILRGRLEGQGPVTETGLAAPLGRTPGDIAAALAALQAEGFAMRGRFTPSAAAEEWCERRLLARIHSYTVKRLRAEIEPVAVRDFMRFLFDWQRVARDARMQGPDSLDTIVGQLEGFEAAAGSWETEILPARLGDYEPAWLDDRCLAGQLTWARLRPSNARSNGGSDSKVAPVRTTPITLLARRHAALWTSLTATADPIALSAHAQTIADSLRQHGASFFHELVEATGLLRTQVEETLAELVALGVVSSDSFGGLRALLVPSSERKPFAGERRRRAAKFGMEDAGRWALARRGSSAAGPEAIEHVARTLLKRYGVVFWRLLAREAAWLPPWRDLLRVYRRLEGRGEIRGGRFVAGLSGEQFALPEAIGSLREIRRRKESGALISVSGADPLNLAGILTPGPKLGALTGNRVLYRDGAPVAMFAGGEVEFLETLDPADQWDARKALLRGASRVRSAAPGARPGTAVEHELERQS
ncbi:MAG TPA: DEAD/DEAH box helicase [Micropepsaceae bacterium]|nr:DEAD/DEAH box helicase [Micropepsaceae bacterium]